jgi:hypothetical protein
MRIQVGRQRREILQLQRAGISIASAELLLARMHTKIDDLCAERERLKMAQGGPTKGPVLGVGTHFAPRAGQLAADTEFMTAKYTEVLPGFRGCLDDNAVLFCTMIATLNLWCEVGTVKYRDRLDIVGRRPRWRVFRSMAQCFGGCIQSVGGQKLVSPRRFRWSTLFPSCCLSFVRRPSRSDHDRSGQPKAGRYLFAPVVRVWSGFCTPPGSGMTVSFNSVGGILGLYSVDLFSGLTASRPSHAQEEGARRYWHV